MALLFLNDSVVAASDMDVIIFSGYKQACILGLCSESSVECGIQSYTENWRNFHSS